MGFRRWLAFAAVAALAQQAPRPRARELGLNIGVYPPGEWNAITDIAGVRVGHTTLRRGANIRTGVTAILPHPRNIFTEKVPGAVFVGNGFGKLMGSTQVNELGEIETPILLTNTLNVPRVADALLDYLLELPGMQQVRSINPVVAETNDGTLNDIRARAVGREDVFSAIRGAASGPVEEGCVGAGTGTVAFGWKGGIGTSSRVLPDGRRIGVLVQTNYGGRLTIAGVPIGDEIRGSPDGSVIIVAATDAPLDHRALMRVASRAMLGLGRTGSAGSNGSGDYVIAFSTNRAPGAAGADLSPMFAAIIEATEEAVYNSLLKAVTTTGNGHTVEALPIDRVVEILKRHGAILERPAFRREPGGH